MQSAYTEGDTAFQNGTTPDDNPYHGVEESAKRIAWFDGYYDARISGRLSRALAAYGLTWERCNHD